MTPRETDDLTVLTELTDYSAVYGDQYLIKLMQKWLDDHMGTDKYRIKHDPERMLYLKGWFEAMSATTQDLMSLSKDTKSLDVQQAVTDLMLKITERSIEV